jgi:hypothetical protein
VACGWIAFAGDNSAEYKWNMDCTMLFIVGEGSGRNVCVYREVGNKGKVETLANNDTAIGIKIVALGSAGGEIARLVSVIAVKKMVEGTFVNRQWRDLLTQPVVEIAMAQSIISSKLAVDVRLYGKTCSSHSSYRPLRALQITISTRYGVLFYLWLLSYAIFDSKCFYICHDSIEMAPKWNHFCTLMGRRSS